MQGIEFSRMDTRRFQESIGLTFRNEELLIRALTHPSYLNENHQSATEDNQRLEFLGDAVLDFISGELLYHRFPDAAEGRLTRLRAALVRTETLAQLALSCHLHEVLLLGKGEEDNGGRQRMSNLCAAFEAVMGAYYLDSGLQAVATYVTPLFEDALAQVIAREFDKDPKSQLQEWAQRHLNTTPVYETIHSEGPDHDVVFTVVVLINGKQCAEGRGKSKRSAAQDAARNALGKMEHLWIRPIGSQSP